MQPCEPFFLHLSLSGDVFVIMFTRDRKKSTLKLKGHQPQSRTLNDGKKIDYCLTSLMKQQ